MPSKNKQKTIESVGVINANINKVQVVNDDDDDSQQYFKNDFINQIRDKLLSSPEDLKQFDPIDVERLKANDNWFIRRFLAWKPTTIDKAINTLVQALIWRKEININHWKDTDFPSEFYQIAACFHYQPDRENANILIIRMRLHLKDPIGAQQLETLARNFFIYAVEKIVSNNPNQGLALMFDCWKSSLSNVDMHAARFVINTLSNYYSGVISYVYIYELPWILNQIWRLIRTWLDDEAKNIIRFITLNNIDNYIDTSNLPDYMGGCCPKDYRFVPKGVPTFKEIVQTHDNGIRKFGLKNDKDLRKVLEHFQKLINLK